MRCDHIRGAHWASPLPEATVSVISRLGDVLAIARVDAALLATLDARAPWGIELPARQGAAFHVVVASFGRPIPED